MLIQKNRIKKIIVFLGALVLVYFCIAIYFINHFNLGTVVNGISLSGKTIGQADEKLSDEVKKYTLELVARDGTKEKIKASDIGLKYNSSNKIKELKDSENPFAWIFNIFSKNNSAISGIVTYDKSLLKKTIDKLSYFEESKITYPENAKLQYTDNKYVIKKEVYGNKIKKDVLYKKVENAILNNEQTINLKLLNCYEDPKYTSSSKEVVNARNLLDKYVSSKITYDSRNKKVVLDGSKIRGWIDVDKNFQVTLNKKKMKNYVINDLGKTFNTFGTSRSFNTSVGKVIQVTGGDYGWLIDTNKEVEDINQTVKDGKAVTKEPIYKQKTSTNDNNDIGKTYVEINLSKQHLWFYKDGALVVEGDVVTGNVSLGHSTPTGVYKLKYKEKNATLKGENYSTPVSFWMPFNGGIGIHDATWRSTFGSNIYLSNGSHGCVNAPKEVANKIFDTIKANTPVVCYTE